MAQISSNLISCKVNLDNSLYFHCCGQRSLGYGDTSHDRARPPIHALLEAAAPAVHDVLQHFAEFPEAWEVPKGLLHEGGDDDDDGDGDDDDDDDDDER